MGSCSGRLLQHEEHRVLMVGLDAVGKTTLLYQLKLGETVTTIPTIGFNVESVTQQNGPDVTIWDVGGQDQIRPLWRHYYQGTSALIYVVDSCDTERIPQAREELHTILADREMTPQVVLVAANKQDMPGSMQLEELTEALGLRSLKAKWAIEGICAVTGDGLPKLMTSLTKLLSEKRGTGK